MKIFFKILMLVFTFSLTAQDKKYKSIAYCTGTGSSIKKYPIAQLTHLIYSFLKVQNDTLCFHNATQKQNLADLVNLKQIYPKLKIIVSIGGWGGCGFCSALFADSIHRVNFAKSTVSLFKEYGIDGLDLDWEYPAIEGYPGHLFSKADKDNFTALVIALRKEMGTAFSLSFAAGGFEQYLEASIDWKTVTPLVDFINLMTYDLVGGYSTVTGHHTPLKDYKSKEQSVEKCVNWLLKNNVPANKLIIGAAFYARVWASVPDTNHGLYQSGKFIHGVSFKEFDTYFADSSGFQQYWDKKAKAPYAYHSGKKLFATFDNTRSIRLKSAYVKRKKLGGIMFWELTQDKTTAGLVSEIYKVLNQ